MTGFGAGRAHLRSPGGSGRIAVEVKSVNQRFLDLRFVLPKEYLPFEGDLRKDVEAAVARGRVEVSVSRSVRLPTPKLQVDLELARAYVAQWRRLQRQLGLPGQVDLSFLRGVGELFRTVEVPRAPQRELPALRRALAEALRRLDRERRREGRALERDIRRRVKRLEELAAAMEERAAANHEATQQRVAARMRDLLRGGVDESRLAQEAAFQAERSDVSEELVRLRSHLQGIAELLGKAEPVGKRIEFLLQEVQREVNTVASKASDLRLIHLAVEAKGEVEKIREQVQNVE
jgi:uncharacterized protein (TIGR00255 family)